MHLTAEDFQSLIHSMGHLGKRQHSDKRKNFRIRTDARATILPLADGRPHTLLTVDVIDVSRMGIAIIAQMPFDPGQQFILCLTFSDLQKTRPILCGVRRVDQISTNEYRMGCEFLEATQPDVPTDAIARGLKKHQAAALAAELKRLEEGDEDSEPAEPQAASPSPISKIAATFFGKR